MTIALIVLCVFLIGALWLQGRIAFRCIDFLLDRLKSADLERDRLLTRITNFQPEPTVTLVAPAQSQAAVIRDLEAPKEYTDDDLADRGLIRNGDGRVVEEETGRLWESPDHLDRWLAFKRERGLPDDADPREYEGRAE